MKTTPENKRTLTANQFGLFAIYAIGFAILVLQIRSLVG